jgi:hypothetical protein
MRGNPGRLRNRWNSVALLSEISRWNIRRISLKMLYMMNLHRSKPRRNCECPLRAGRLRLPIIPHGTK